MNRIISIKEIFDVKFDKGYGKYDGYKVVTEKEKIKILIENGQSCCENWGMLESQDDLDYFVGAELLDIELTYDGINETITKEIDDDDECSAQLITFKTDRGNFQLGVYNSHNGYYGHSFFILRNDEVIEQGGL